MALLLGLVLADCESSSEEGKSVAIVVHNLSDSNITSVKIVPTNGAAIIDSAVKLIPGESKKYTVDLDSDSTDVRITVGNYSIDKTVLKSGATYTLEVLNTNQFNWK